MDSATTDKVSRLVDNIEQVIFGKREAVKLCVVGLLARGHVLIEDIPGIGKTTLAQALARSIDCEFQRIQFTSDMLPTDILGVSVLSPRTNEFEFRAGPIFANVVLADEVNRTPPKTQSALLEAMSEAQISMDGITRALPAPFIVLATQNPHEYEGTYLLPESQLDRFMLRIEIGYPSGEDELLIMRRRDPWRALNSLEPVLTGKEVEELQDIAANVQVEESVAQYILEVIQATRWHDQVQLGASPRSSVALYEGVQARALVEGRDYATPDDVKRMAVPVLSHRLLIKNRGGAPGAIAQQRDDVVNDILAQTPVPV